MIARRFLRVWVLGSVLILAMTLRAGAAQEDASRSGYILSFLNQSGLTPAARSTALSDFRKLPDEVQDLVLQRVSSAYCVKNGLASPAGIYKIPMDQAAVAAPSIKCLLPSKASPGQFVIAEGTGFTPDCVAKVDGKEAETSALIGLLIFKTPSAPLGTAHSVTVMRKTGKAESAPASLKTVAYVGYRGVKGWKFPNFPSADFGWNIFRDYFTPAAVEYSPNNPRPSALAWYNAAYKGIGHGGNCLGMSIRSIRTMRGSYSGCWASWWPSHLQPTIWDYPSDPQLLDMIREDQGTQLCAQALALHNDRKNHQDHNQAFKFISDAIASGDSARQPIMCMWVSGSSGHAIVAYKTERIGDDCRIYVYDNNKPYSETETSDNGSMAHVYAGANSFSYTYGSGWNPANRLLAFSYNELVYNPPLLPADAVDTVGLASTCTIVVSDSQTAIQQITDESGHTFFAGGQENMNPATRIPDSTEFIPMTGGKYPADAPAIFVFNHAVGRSLTFDLKASAANNVRVFSPKTVTTMNLVSGQFSLRNIMQPTQELNLGSPGQMGLQHVEMISVQPDRSERVFRMQDFKNLGQGAMKVTLSGPGDALAVSGVAAQFNLNIRGASSAGERTASTPVAVQAGKIAAVTVPDFRSLQNSTLKLETR